MSVFDGLLITVVALIGTPQGPPLFFLGLIISIAASLWTQTRWLYWMLIVVGSAPFATLIVLSPALVASSWGSASNLGPNFALWMQLSMATAPFGVGVLLGSLLAPVFRWGL
jgi:hypothetical protein